MKIIPFVLILIGAFSIWSCGKSGEDTDTSSAVTSESDDELISPPVPTTGTYLTSCDDSDNCFHIQNENSSEKELFDEGALGSFEIIVLDQDSQVIADDYYQIYFVTKFEESGSGWTQIHLVTVGLNEDLIIDSLLIGYDDQIIGTKTNPDTEGFVLKSSYTPPSDARLYVSTSSDTATDQLSPLSQYVGTHFKPLAGPPRKKPPAPPMRPGVRR